MKKFTHLLGIALMALMLVPQVVMAQKSRVTLTFVGSDGNPVRQAEATIGEDFTEPRLTCDYPEVLRSVTYSSSGNNIASRWWRPTAEIWTAKARRLSAMP